jgi:hypothetical protein
VIALTQKDVLVLEVVVPRSEPYTAKPLPTGKRRLNCFAVLATPVERKR